MNAPWPRNCDSWYKYRRTLEAAPVRQMTLSDAITALDHFAAYVVQYPDGDDNVGPDMNAVCDTIDAAGYNVSKKFMKRVAIEQRWTSRVEDE